MNCRGLFRWCELYYLQHKVLCLLSERGYGVGVRGKKGLIVSGEISILHDRYKEEETTNKAIAYIYIYI